MKDKVGGLEAKCDQYHSYITELREMIQSVKILQGPSQRTPGRCSPPHVKLRDQISHIFPDSPSLGLWFLVGTTHISSSVTMFTGFPASTCDHALFTLLQTTCIVMNTLLCCCLNFCHYLGH